MRVHLKWITTLSLTALTLTILCYWKQLTLRISQSPREKQLPLGRNLELGSKSELQPIPPSTVEGPQTCRSICRLLPSNLTEQERRLKLVGNLTISKDVLAQTELQTLTKELQPLVRGGSWMYRDPEVNEDKRCNVNDSSAVAIIIPLRGRWHQVPALLSTLVPLLRKQKVCYRIFIVEQADNSPFNRAKLFNVGFVEARKLFRFKCAIFHDVDLVPINDLNPYGCDKEASENVIHLGVGLDVRNFRLNYPKLVGGVLKMTVEQFLSVNGFSNRYWGWGQEDDDMERRLQRKQIKYIHIDPSIARYAAMEHVKQEKVRRPEHLSLLKSANMRMTEDGLNTLDYKLFFTQEESLFTHMVVDLRE